MKKTQSKAKPERALKWIPYKIKTPGYENQKKSGGNEVFSEFFEDDIEQFLLTLIEAYFIITVLFFIVEFKWLFFKFFFIIHQ